MAMNKIDPHHSKSIHVSFDIDSLDPLEAPSTGTPGTYNQLYYIIQNVVLVIFNSDFLIPEF